MSVPRIFMWILAGFLALLVGGIAWFSTPRRAAESPYLATVIKGKLTPAEGKVLSFSLAEKTTWSHTWVGEIEAQQSWDGRPP